MSFSADIYQAIAADILQGVNASAPLASRLVTYKNDISVIFGINRFTQMKSAYFAVHAAAPKSSFPAWKGVTIETVEFPAYGTNQIYVGLMQTPSNAEYIFEIVVEDLRSTIATIDSVEDCLVAIINILEKWRDFFKAEREMVLSDELQQGLYGELLFLEESLEEFGSAAVNHWAGAAGETHDFYISSDAVEIKTTGQKEPYAAKISSEYQLDSTDIPGNLYLRFYAFRRSQTAGDTLNDIVGRLRIFLSADQAMLALFNTKLQQYGYYDEVAYSYKMGYYMRDTYTFEVSDGFPRIVRSQLQNGVSHTVYAVSIAQCMPYAITKDELYHSLKGV